MSDREERKKDMRDQAAIKDSINTGGLENHLAQKKQDQRSNQLLDVEETKEQLRKALLGQEKVATPVKTQDGKERFQVQWKETSEKKLCNKKGFDMVWSQIESKLNDVVTGAYLPAKTIDKMVMAACYTIVKQIAVKPHEYGVSDTSDAAEIADIARSTIMANSSRGRGGRALKSQEKTIVEKISKTLTEDEEESGGKMPDLFS